ncbi:uncharacterized protein [Malus domestica]|uniref:uncharacterized protein isoform X7 n=1 Tax=Malus domestica TaxID=3750 RepID=UPI00397705B5
MLGILRQKVGAGSSSAMILGQRIRPATSAMRGFASSVKKIGRFRRPCHRGDWVFRVCDFSLKPAKTCVFKEIRFFGFLTFLCSLRRPLYLREEILNLQKLGFQEIANPAETLGFLASSPTYLFRRSPPSLLHQTRRWRPTLSNQIFERTHII